MESPRLSEMAPQSSFSTAAEYSGCRSSPATSVVFPAPELPVITMFAGQAPHRPTMHILGRRRMCRPRSRPSKCPGRTPWPAGRSRLRRPPSSCDPATTIAPRPTPHQARSRRRAGPAHTAWRPARHPGPPEPSWPRTCRSAGHCQKRRRQRSGRGYADRREHPVGKPDTGHRAAQAGAVGLTYRQQPVVVADTHRFTPFACSIRAWGRGPAAAFGRHPPGPRPPRQSLRTIPGLPGLYRILPRPRHGHRRLQRAPVGSA